MSLLLSLWSWSYRWVSFSGFKSRPHTIREVERPLCVHSLFWLNGILTCDWYPLLFVLFELAFSGGQDDLSRLAISRFFWNTRLDWLLFVAGLSHSIINLLGLRELHLRILNVSLFTSKIALIEIVEAIANSGETCQSKEQQYQARNAELFLIFFTGKQNLVIEAFFLLFFPKSSSGSSRERQEILQGLNADIFLAKVTVEAVSVVRASCMLKWEGATVAIRRQIHTRWALIITILSGILRLTNPCEK